MAVHTYTEYVNDRISRAIGLALIALMVTGCVIPAHRGVQNETPPLIAQRVTQHFPSQLYRLAAGDVLEFVYLFIPSMARGPYRIRVEDQIDLEFAFHPELNRTVTVRPDGGISIPRKGDVRVAGKTAEQVKNRLEEMYADLLKDPEITVTVRLFHTKLSEVRNAITTGGQGQSKQITVDPDGHVALPLIPAVMAEGKSVPQINEEVNHIYSHLVRGLKVSVLLREIVGNVLFVDGEVTNPGVFTSRGPITVQQAIALAGGMEDTAEPRSVLVISKGPDGRFITRSIDLSNLRSVQDFRLRRNDLVYVPKSYIARADIWVNQNITQLLLFSGWSLGLTGDFGRAL